eukprot:m.98541 g.98541  ORF g.98541 m.98541 type:complete len:646 (-) comp10265_c0_seq2:76-2013(-)
MFADADDDDDHGAGELLEATLSKQDVAGAAAVAHHMPVVTATKVGSVVVALHGSRLDSATNREDGGEGAAVVVSGLDGRQEAHGSDGGKKGGGSRGGRSEASFTTATKPHATTSMSWQQEDEGAWDENSDDDYNFDYGDEIGFAAGKDGSVTAGGRSLQPREHALAGMYRKVRVERYDGPQLSDAVSNKIVSSDKKVAANRIRKTDKSDRATTEQVLDPRTRMILFKMLNRGIFSEINGCISTGKEANVYHAVNHETKRELAIKVYKTSILVFKDRDRYVTGEFRFRRGYNKHNPREMVKLWAEKESRNLNRLRQAGIPCPETVILRSHVLVMDFVGKDGWNAPKLKDANITERKARELYVSCVVIMRNMYQKAKLVHGDFSEYNILYYEGELVVIDVSQAVEHAHPHALEFLRTDITNVNDFFGRKGVPVMTHRELFDFITDIMLQDDAVDARLEEIQRTVEQRMNQPVTAEATREAEMEEALFMKAFIPTSLDQVVDMERDIELLKEGQAEKLYYTSLTALTAANADDGKAQSTVEVSESQKDDTTRTTTTTDGDTDDGRGGASVGGTHGGDGQGEDEAVPGQEEEEEEDEDDDEWEDRTRASETPEEKRLRKQAVKEAKREKRQTKTPKHVKKKQNNKHKRK